jgi:hypothetical protein
MRVLHAPKASERKGITASQWLYREYVAAKRKRNRKQMEAAREALVRLCISACGKLRPHWSPPSPPEGFASLHPFATFHFDGIRDRRRFVEEFLQNELIGGMTATGARYIPRRCRLRLIDEIRSDTRREWGFGRKSNDQYRAALEKVKRLHPPWKWTDDQVRLLWQHIKESCPEWRDASNVSIAEDLFCSEGWIRKLRKKLAERLWAIAENDEQRKALEVLKLKPRCRIA